MALERIQKIVAAAGVASRRKAEELITSGRVSVNGTTVTELGSKADPETDDIRVDGRRLSSEEHVYILAYKPKEFVTTVSDPEGRPTVMDLVRDVRERVFPVGRLDYHSEGLLLLTNDGDLMQQLTSAVSHVPKTYLVKVAGQPTEDDLNRLRAGIKLPPEPSMTKGRGYKKPGENRRSFGVTTQPAKIELVREGDNPWYEITLTEGRNRQIRRMFEEIGFHVEKIKRIKYGPLELNVEPGRWRYLSHEEVVKLRRSLGKPMNIRPPKIEAERVERDVRKLAEKIIRKSSRGRDIEAERQKARERRKAERRPRRDEGFGGEQRRYTRPERGESTRRERPSFEREDRPRRDAGTFERSERPRRDAGSFQRSDRPRRDAGTFERGERPRREERGFERGNRPRREAGDFRREERPRREAGGFRREDRPRREERGFREERPRRDTGAKFERSERPRREGNSDRPRREGASFERPRREGGFDRPRREGAANAGFNRERGGKSFGRSERPPRFERSERPRGERPEGPRGGREDRNRTPRPQGRGERRSGPPRGRDDRRGRRD